MKTPKKQLKPVISNLRCYRTRNLSGHSTIKDKLISKSRKIRFEEVQIALNDKDIEPLFSLEDYIEKVPAHLPLQFKCKKCNKEFSKILYSVEPISCKYCTSAGTASQQELKLYNWLHQFIECEASVRGILDKNSELDIFVRDKKVAIEFDGLYWHSDKYGRDETYHVNKTNQCSDKGIRLIHIFEDEWYNNQKAVKFTIKHILGLTPGKIYARNCQVKQISSKKAKRFLDKYHISKYIKSDSAYGLFYKNRLVFVMTFDIYSDKWLIKQFASLFHYTIVGGISKISKFIREKYRCELAIVSDNRWSNGESLLKAGFKFSSSEGPRCYYIKNRKRLSKESFNENQNPEQLGYHKIWDCGHKTFIFNPL